MEEAKAEFTFSFWFLHSKEWSVGKEAGVGGKEGRTRGREGEEKLLKLHHVISPIPSLLVWGFSTFIKIEIRGKN